VTVDHKVPNDQRRCTACGGDKLTPLGEGKKTTVWEFVPARFVRMVHVQEVLRCRCNGCVITAPGAPKVVERGQYGASFLAYIVVAKCADHTPIYRLEKALARQGVPIPRSTMNELLHRAAEVLEPLWRLLRDVVLIRPVVMADETRLRLVREKDGKTKNGFVWTFGGRDDDGNLDIAYVFAEDRSGSTPKTLLEGTSAVLLVDGDSGYSVVDTISSRRRAACHAHLRRYFHEALPTAPVAQELLDLVSQLYLAEHDADAKGLSGSPRLEFRKQRAGPIRDRIRAWLDEQKHRHPPKRRWARPSATPPANGKGSECSSRTNACPWTTTALSGLCDAWRWGERTSSSPTTLTPAPTSPGSTPSWPPARRGASTRSSP
jgi:transposase